MIPLIKKGISGQFLSFKKEGVVAKMREENALNLNFSYGILPRIHHVSIKKKIKSCIWRSTIKIT